MKLYGKCAYVILDEDRLLDADRGLSPSKPIVENKPWVAVKDWLDDAAKLGEQVPVVMADAKSVNRWLGWATLSDVKVSTSSGTRAQSTYFFSNLRPPLGLEHSKFQLLNEDCPLSEGHIRSYAHLRTPSFLHELSAQDGPLLSEWLNQSFAVDHVFETGFKDAQLRHAARTVLLRAVERVQSIAPSNWGVVLTPGRIRLVVGNEEVVDIGNHNDEFLFAYEVPNNEEEPDGVGPLIEQFDKWESAFMRIVERLASVPRMALRHSPAVLEYLLNYSSAPARDQPPANVSVPASNADSIEALRAELESQAETFDPLDEQDGRRRVLASLVYRQGQTAFRSKLLQAYDGRCAITGWAVADVLEAAYIIPYRGEHTNHVTNGLLLRSDLHALFDLHLLQIDPETQSVVIDERLRESPYGEMHGAKLRLPEDSTLGPAAEYLRRRLEIFEG